MTCGFESHLAHRQLPGRTGGEPPDRLARMSAVEIGQKAPDFTVMTTHGELSLSGLLASSRAGVVVYFYPKASTPGCTKEACDFRDSLASDPEHHVLEAYGAWGDKKNYGRTYVGIIRSTVVVAPDGRVALAQYNVKATGHVARLRKALGLD